MYQTCKLFLGRHITIIGFIWTKVNFPENFYALEIIWTFTNLNVVLMTVPFFIILQSINFKPRKIISLIADASYGIFLSHFIIVHIVFEFSDKYISQNPYLMILVNALISFTLVSILIIGLRRYRFFQYLT